MSDKTTPCAFCGHPDSRHRVMDAIRGRVEAGEDRLQVATDYGWTCRAGRRAVRRCDPVDPHEGFGCGFGGDDE